MWLVGPDSRAVEKFHQEISDDVLMQMLAVFTSIQSLAGEHLVFTHVATNGHAVSCVQVPCTVPRSR